jgi:predicted deacylase
MFFDTPDLTPYRAGSDGLPYVHSWRSGLPGPHVCINALTHGNEICGAWALDALIREGVRPVCGTLSLSFANVEAYARFDRNAPEATRWVDEDMNRVWDESTLDGPRNSRELARARELRGFFASVDFLLDLHSMHTPGPALGLCGATRGGLAFARRLGVPEHLVIDNGHAAGRRLRDYGDFSDEASGRQALLVECGYHFDPASVDVARLAARRFLDVTGVCPGLCPQPPCAAPRAVRIVDTVTIGSDDFSFTADWQSMQTVARAGTVLAIDGGRPVVTPCDDCVLVMPAPPRYQRAGMTAVRLGCVETQGGDA